MKKILLTLMVLISTQIQASEIFTKRASGEPILTQEGAKKHWCPICGMSLKKFYKTSHTSGEDKKQFCSIRCLAVALDANNSIGIGKVVDAKTEKLIYQKNAFYVVGSEIQGTMTKVSKLAFSTKKDAEAFIEEYDGKIVKGEYALDMARKSLKSDIAMVNKKKQKKIYPMGKKIYEKKCQQDINISSYREINELKSDIKNNNLCKSLKGMQFQAVTLYLWEVKRVEELSDNNEIIKVDKTDKCPVCGMFNYKYPKWVTEIYYGDKVYSFDGVKDMMKFYFEPNRWGRYPNAKKESISKILVTDYYSQKAIDGKSAYYIIGSDVLGPMGNELIPFADESDAKIFMGDHRGKSIVRFDEIVEKEVYRLDE